MVFLVKDTFSSVSSNHCWLLWFDLMRLAGLEMDLSPDFCWGYGTISRSYEYYYTWIQATRERERWIGGRSMFKHQTEMQLWMQKKRKQMMTNMSLLGDEEKREGYIWIFFFFFLWWIHLDIVFIKILALKLKSEFSTCTSSPSWVKFHPHI